MELRLHRFDVSPRRTIGKLAIDGVFVCFTLEDPVHEGPKIQGETAIPEGRYEVVINRSRRFQRMLPQILDVPGFTGIRIHGGNTAADTDGCILVGQNRAVDSIISSQLALGDVQRRLAGVLASGERVWITVTAQDVNSEQIPKPNRTEPPQFVGHIPEISKDEAKA